MEANNLNVNNDKRIYSFMLAMIPGVGDMTIASLLDTFKTAENVFKAKEGELELAGISKKKLTGIIKMAGEKEAVREKVREWSNAGINAVFINEENYPKSLKNLYDAPYVIFYKGQLPVDSAPSVAVVGARACTDYGKNIAFSFGKQLALEGIQIISGMAAGADHYGHKGALAGGGYTAGVLGCGVDICYPRNNFNTYMEMQSTGCVMSELLPGTSPAPGLFPRRNRLIAAISDAVLIIEAREKSGSLITADQALEQGKDVFAVPGRIGDPLSTGCLSLIKQGAYPLTNLNDILECDSIKRKSLSKITATQPDPSDRAEKFAEAMYSEDEIVYNEKVCRILTDNPKNINRIMYETGLSYEIAAQALLSLELEGRLRSISAGLYVRSANNVFL